MQQYIIITPYSNMAKLADAARPLKIPWKWLHSQGQTLFHCTLQVINRKNAVISQVREVNCGECRND